MLYSTQIKNMKHISAKIPVEMYILIKQLKGYKKISDIVREALDLWLQKKSGKSYEELTQEVKTKLEIYREAEMIIKTSKSASETIERLKQLATAYGMDYNHLKKIYNEIKELL